MKNIKVVVDNGGKLVSVKDQQTVINTILELKNQFGIRNVQVDFE